MNSSSLRIEDCDGDTLEVYMSHVDENEIIVSVKCIDNESENIVLLNYDDTVALIDQLNSLLSKIRPEFNPMEGM